MDSLVAFCKVIHFLLFFTPSVLCLPLDEFYPFGFDNGDQVLPPMTDGSSGPIALRIPFPFFDRLETQLSVDVHGTLLFEGLQAHHTPECGPLESLSRMIAVFWADIVTHGGVDGEVFYRQEVSPALLRRAAREIAETFPEMTALRLRWLFVGTWINVTFYGAEGCQPNPSQYPRNTFQVVLATDGTVSFAIFNYNSIVWTTSRFRTSAGNCSGLGGFPARVGFDPGDQKNFYSLPESCTDAIVHVDTISNTGKPGKWLFRVDNTNALHMTGNCDYDNATQLFDDKLRITPRFIDVFGGPVTIYGPCFNARYAKTFCTFHDPIKGKLRVEGRNIQQTAANPKLPPKVICIAPFIHETGNIKVELEIIDGEFSRSYYGSVTVIKRPPEVDVTFIEQNNGTDKVKIDWDPHGSAVLNATKVNIEILRFQADTMTWIKGGVLAKEVANSGRYEFQASLLPEDDLAIVSVVKSAAGPASSSRTRRGADKDSNNPYIDISSYGNNYIEADVEMVDGTFNEVYRESEVSDFLKRIERKTPSEKEQACNRWFEQDEGIPSLALDPCPPTLALARSDLSFEQDRCAYFLVKDTCLTKYHPGAFESFVSVNPTPDGFGQQCTYDRNGSLLIGPPAGGTADLASPWSFFGETNHVERDVVPWIACCSEGNLTLCRKFYEKRPSDDGTRYQTRAIGAAVGDPHMATFDELEYTFNGVGEFWMVNSSFFKMQARMEKFAPMTNPNASTTIMASVFTAFAMRGDTGPTVQIQLSQTGRHVVEIFVNGELLPFDSRLMLSRHAYPGVSIRSKSPNLSEILVSFSCGMSFRFLSTSDAMSVVSMASTENHGQLSGLLGNFDGNPSNDLTTPNGTKLDPKTATPSMIHYDFGLKWEIKASESLFFYIGGKRPVSFSEPDFVPTFDVPAKVAGEMPQEVVAVCGKSQSCFFDYYVSGGDVKLATHTAKVVTLLQATENLVKQQQRQIDAMCPPLSSPRNGFMTSAKGTSFFSGVVVQFACNSDSNFILNGSSAISCQNGTWSDEPPTCLPFAALNVNLIEVEQVTPQNDRRPFFIGFLIIAAVCSSILVSCVIIFVTRRGVSYYRTRRQQREHHQHFEEPQIIGIVGGGCENSGNNSNLPLLM